MPRSARKLVICVRNDGYDVSLERRKLYVLIPGVAAERHKQVRIIDASGEDYLYPKQFFVDVDLPAPVKRAVLQAA